MDHLEEVSVEELREALDDVEGRKSTQRLLAAIAYKNGADRTCRAARDGPADDLQLAAAGRHRRIDRAGR